MKTVLPMIVSLLLISAAGVFIWWITIGVA